MIIIGLIAAFLTTLSGLPQLFKLIKTKETKNLSLISIIMLVLGVFIWFIYGLFINDLPIIFANLIASIIQSIILFYKLKYNE